MLPEWINDKRTTLAYEETPRVKYGLTIRLDTRSVSLTHETDSEQVVTLEHDGCEVFSLFGEPGRELLKKHLFSTGLGEDTSFERFQQANADIGLVVIVPPGKEATVDLSRTITSDSFVEQILIVAGKDSRLTFSDKYHGSPGLKSSAVEIIAAQGAKVRFSQTQFLGTDSVDATRFGSLVHKDAQVDWFVASLGGSLTRASTHNRIVGEGGVANSYGVFLGRGNQQFDISASTYHEGNRSVSDMYVRGVLNGKSKAVFRGLLDIHADAFGCEGYQKDETILLSGDAVADAIPNLEIRNNDVACSHGATIGRVDEEQLFYLTSRGVAEDDAVQMIVEGFFEPVAARLGWPELYERIKPFVLERLA